MRHQFKCALSHLETALEFKHFVQVVQKFESVKSEIGKESAEDGTEAQ